MTPSFSGCSVGEDQSTVAERAQTMIDNWYYFSSNSVDDRGHETCRDWMDPEIVRLLDEAYDLTRAVFGRIARWIN